METQNVSTTTPMPVPSHWWCRWKALKGANPRRLTIPDIDLRHKWIVLTGGNSGIGYEAALQFVKWGANIILGCRQPPPHEMHPDAAVEKIKAAALAAGHKDTVIEWWEVDMGSLESVEAFGKRWLAQDRRLDILANNAGIGGWPGEAHYTGDGFEIIHQVQVTCSLVVAAEADHTPGELYFPCAPHSDVAALVGQSFTASDYLYNFVHAIFWHFRSGECEQWRRTGLSP
jgi:NAD(P)-dependent dehydrogenase (short-subunit alcohol dehydrogenase family)